MTEQLWAMEESHLHTYLSKVENATQDQIDAAAMRYPMQAELSLPQIDGDTAMMRVEGVLLKHRVPPILRYFGIRATSYADIIDSVAFLKEQPGIKRCKVIYDTPGGTISGLDAAYQAMADLATSIDVDAEVRGMCCSAGYYLASCSKTITATAPSDWLGSIGVLVAHTSYKGMKERYGVKDIVITSNNAPKKAPDLNTESGRQVVQDQVDALERIFYQRISEGRGVSKEHIAKNFGQGGVLVAFDPEEGKPDAVGVGMIDKTMGVEKIKKISKGGKTMNLSNKFAESVVSGDYPKAIKGLANRVLNGDSNMGALAAAVAAHEMLKDTSKPTKGGLSIEQLKAQNRAETAMVNADRKRLGMPPIESSFNVPDGTGMLVSTEDDLRALVARDRKRLGISAK